MPDMEKVINGLETCSTGKCETSCPYHNIPQCTTAILCDALNVLRDQQNKQQRNPVIVCPHCGKRVV